MKAETRGLVIVAVAGVTLLGAAAPGEPPERPVKFIKVDDWNAYEVVAVGSRIKTSINGHPCVDLDDPAGARRGIFAFQIHSGGPMEVRFKDLKLEVPAAK